MISIGTPLPAYTGEALMPGGQFGSLSFSDYRGKWLVLFFYPLDFTFVCPTEIRAFDELAGKFAASGAQLLGASVDSVHTHRAWTEHGLGRISFPLIGDLSRQLAGACGVLAPEGFAHRATFIIDPEGVVQSASINASNVGRSADETLRLLQALQAGGLTACGWTPGQALLKAA